jgi:hypothetical protein
VVLFGSMLLLGRLGPIPAAMSIGISSLAHMLVLALAVDAQDGFIRQLLRALRAPLVGCLGMAVVVLVVRARVEAAAAHDLVLLSAEIAAGAGAYVAWLLLLERPAVRDVYGLAKRLVARGAR